MVIQPIYVVCSMMQWPIRIAQGSDRPPSFCDRLATGFELFFQSPGAPISSTEQDSSVQIKRAQTLAKSLYMIPQSHGLGGEGRETS